MAAALTGVAQAQENAQIRRCEIEAVGTASIHSVIDGRTLLLGDGREIRLAGLEVPESKAPATQAALEVLVSGREVALKRLGPETDRHGRIVAYAFVPGADGSVQQALLARGHARVSARVGSSGCAAELWAAERQARTARLGVWAEGHYVVRRAENPAEVSAERGRFTLVEGKVLSVREAGATIYVNFGRRWSDDFTVTVPKRSERAFAAAGLELRKLTGRHVRIRGTVEERGGPWIEALRPEQIEVAQDIETGPKD